MKKILISLIALSLLTASFMTGCAKNNDDNKTENNGETPVLELPEVILTEEDGISLMNVGGKNISKAHLRYYLSNLKAQSPDADDEEIVESAINMLKQATAAELLASTYGVDFDEAAQSYYDETIAYSIEQCNAQEGSSYEAVLDELYLTDTVYRDITRNSLLTSLVYSEYATEGGKKYIAATDSEIIDAVKEDYVRVKHVLVKTDELETEEELAQAKALADDIHDRAVNGENFEDLVTQYSADGMDVEKGYYFTTGKMVPSFETASFMLSEGGVAMAESVYGYHIIKRYPMVDEHILGDETLRQEVLGKIYSEKFTADLVNVQNEIEYTVTDAYESAVAEILASVSAK
jgi:hypothetical protein